MSFKPLFAVFTAILLSSTYLAAKHEPQFFYCPHELYGTTTTGPNGASELLALDPTDGTGTSLGTITGGVERVTAIDFSPYGFLYGVGEDENDVSVLIRINCYTAEAYIVGPTGIPSSNTINDISFDRRGKLWAYTHNGNGNPPDEVGTINLRTGAFTSVGQTGVPLTSGNGLFHDGCGNLFHAGGADLSLINTVTGAGSFVATLQFFPPALDNPRFTSLDYDKKSGLIYGALNDKKQGQNSPPENYLVTLNVFTGETQFLTNPVLNAPNNLSGIAFFPF